MPVIGPNSAAKLRAFVEAPQPGQPRREEVDKLVVLLRTSLPAKAASEVEGGALLDQYWLGLSDVPVDALRHAYTVIIREDKWFPTVARIREASAGSAPSDYRARRLVAKTLLLKHRNEWREPLVDQIGPDDAKLLTDTLASMTDALLAPEAATALERPKRLYCPTCYIAMDNPAVADCAAPNCGKPEAATKAEIEQRMAS
jgi:hypothetical protein